MPQLLTRAESPSLALAGPATLPARPAVAAPARPDREAVARAAKRGFDLVGAALLLGLLVPVLLLIAVAVRASSPGPVLYRQRRIGAGGVSFDILKFRSMRCAAAGQLALTAGSAPGGVEGLDRRTAVGAFLRRTSLDELPQLWNVVVGEMSLVGPRPERPAFVELFADEVPGYADRHAVRGGITGLAQVRGLRGQTSIAERALADQEYVRTWGLLLDLRILLRTVLCLRHDTEQPRR